MFTPQEAKLLDDLLRDKLKAKKGHVEGEKQDVVEKVAIIYASILAKIQQDLPKQSSQRPARVLVVDDVESMRALNIQLMKQIGFTNIDQTSSAQKALQMIKQAHSDESPYGVVLADWEMPEMTGLQLLQEVRKNPEINHTPFYLLTSITDKTNVIEAIKSGVTGYLTKPFSHKSLLEKVKHYL
jgi:two-component system chemotaxis response regulator CheY